MNRRSCLWALAASGAPLVPPRALAQAPAQPATPPAAGPATIEVAGVKFDTSLQLGTGAPLVLNGAGVRYKAIFKVYAAALYLQTRTSNPDTAMTSPGAKRLHLVMLRNVDGNEFGKLLSAGIEKNATREEFIRSLPSLTRMGEAAARYRQLLPGDTLFFDWIPDAGFNLYVKGNREVGPVNDLSIFKGMMKIWLGASPADQLLKEGLLGLRDAASGARLN